MKFSSTKLFKIIFPFKGRVIGVTIGCIIGMTPIPLAALFRNGS